MGYFDDVARPSWATSEPILADVTPLEAIPAPSRKVHRDTRADQDQLREWYRTCGPVRIIVNTRASTVSQCQLTVVRKGLYGDETVETQWARSLTSTFKPQRGSQQDFLRQIAVHLQTPADGYLQTHVANGDISYILIPSEKLKPVHNRPGWSTYTTSRNARIGDRGYHEVNDRFLWYFHHPDPSYPDDPWSPILAGAESIYRYEKAYRHVGRTLDQKLAISSILWAKATTQGSNWQKNVWDWAFAGAENDDGIESISPLLMSTEQKPEFLPGPDKVYQDQLIIGEDALKSFARSQDYPTIWLTDSVGVSKYDNEDAVLINYLDNSIASLKAEVADIATRVHLRPMLEATELGRGLDPSEYRFHLSDLNLRPQRDNDHDPLELYRQGLLTRGELARQCGIDPVGMLSLPDGIGEYEHWLATQAPAAISTSPYGVSGIHRPDPATLADSGLVELEAVPIGEPVSAELTQWDDLI